MAHAGMTIENRAAGDSLVFVETREDGSDRLVLDLSTLKGGSGPPEHVHPSSSEVFEVQEGAIAVEVDGVQQTVVAGETFTVASGTRHKFLSDRERPGRTRVTLDNPGRLEDFLVTLYELARTERVRADGKPSLLQIAVSGAQVMDDIRATAAPWAAQRAVFAFLGPIGRLRGLKPFYEWGELTARS